MAQSWRDLLFAHWRVSVSALRPLVPQPLQVEEHAGSAWVGLTPFRIANLHPRWLPAVPPLSSFPELNLRTYVRLHDKPGIFFFSLDVASRMTVVGARFVYKLPYFRARMRMQKRAGGWIAYRSQRLLDNAEVALRYRPAGASFIAQPGSLESFLTERYALYTVHHGLVLRGDIHHAPWVLRPAEGEIFSNTVAQAAGLHLEGPPLLHYAARQDTLIWPPASVTSLRVAA